mmetsp:Transcript_6723/g.12909  ORF Transcript_6723/g.12909 Transcript_6723/m.12909 type:complete len:233 (-) Transcript_6723:150-848(-)
MNVQGCRNDLGSYGNGQGHGELGRVAFDAVFFLQVIGSLGCRVEGRVHGCRITCGKESKGTHGGVVLGGIRGEFSCKDGITPGQQGNVRHGRRGDLELLAFLIAADLVDIKSQFGQVGNSVGTKVYGKGQSKGETSKEGLGLSEHFPRRLGDGLHELGGSTNVLNDALINHRNQRRHQSRSGGGTSDFFGTTSGDTFHKVVRIGVVVSKDPVTHRVGLAGRGRGGVIRRRHG